MKDEPSCVLAQETELRVCENDADLCYAWFDRTGEVVERRPRCSSCSLLSHPLDNRGLAWRAT